MEYDDTNFVFHFLIHLLICTIIKSWVSDDDDVKIHVANFGHINENGMVGFVMQCIYMIHLKLRFILCFVYLTYLSPKIYSFVILGPTRLQISILSEQTFIMDFRPSLCYVRNQ